MTEKMLSEIVDGLFPNRKKFQFVFAHDAPEDAEEFDFPEYGGLPKKISSRLSPEAVDAIQSIVHDPYSDYVRKRDFSRTIKNRMLELGEKFYK